MVRRCCVLLAVLVTITLMQTPVAATDTGLVYQGGTVDIQPLREFAFNWSWWGLDRGISLSFIYTTNNISLPVRCEVNNSHYTIMYAYDYFTARVWNATEFPAIEEIWWFAIENPHNRTVRVNIDVTYEVRPSDTVLSQFFIVSGLTAIGIVVALLAVFQSWMNAKSRTMK